MLAYLSYMALRLVECRSVLKETGSIYLHCDPTASHYLKVVLDAVFGAKNFGMRLCGVIQVVEFQKTISPENTM